ncbi:YicC/YloC family endoribonuclease [Devosia sp. FJ2-5-3]|uniref:YicC/YloC family endoribonuclease n=1 Tax=Devosia sp. FJ2-5-3 TaxID=2976680 RepID=UPI0023D7E1C5|nr:YicC/YloC family endoribonuclease [Devosia sp. FJ2-5-3]WEJ57435.1 YicC family protein [Devosia sp. FJ2-5-3]
MSAALASMTGFARAEAANGALRARIEIKSVNGRGLDIRTRFAQGLDIFDLPVRQLLSQALSRGSLNVSLTLDRGAAGKPITVNEAALATIIAAANDLAQRLEVAPPRVDGLLALPGVLAVEEADALDEEAVGILVTEAAQNALSALQASRREEGSRIATTLSDQLDQIAVLVEAAAIHPSRNREQISARLKAQIEALNQQTDIAPERFAQEVLLLVTKADIQEEIDRLRAHIAGARKLIAQGGPVGRRLDFLAQEFNREANTLCSKSNAVELTTIGLDLKAVIDQLREQVQNIE